MNNGEIVEGTVGGDARSITPARKAKYNPSTGQFTLNIGKGLDLMNHPESVNLSLDGHPVNLVVSAVKSRPRKAIKRKSIKRRRK